MHITVLYGGVSEERAVSLQSGVCVLRALERAGAQVRGVELAQALPDEGLLCELAQTDAVFLALHGGAGEDGSLQACLEAHGIFHYTGTGPQGSALAMHKARAKRAVAAMGGAVAGDTLLAQKGECAPLPYPFVTKPVQGGSSVGVFMITTAKEWEALTPSGPFLCEEYLPGREFSVGILGGRALPPVEICPREGFYDYAHKYTKGACEEKCPAPLSPPRRAALQNFALLAFLALGLRDYARIDFKENAQGELCFLEANTLPGMTECSLLPLAASHAGMGMEALCLTMAKMAAARRGFTTRT